MHRLAFGSLLIVALMLGMAPPAFASDEPFVMRVPVLMYHHIQCEVVPADNVNVGLFLCPDRFDAQLRLLKRRGWHTVTASQLAEAMLTRTCLPKKTFVITLDDGWLDGYLNGTPVMEKYGFRGTFAMVVARAGDPNSPTPDRPHFNWDQARDLVVRGFDIANHTMTHTSVASLDEAMLNQQVSEAQAKQELELGFAPTVFVYPYGSVGSGTAPAYLSSRFSMALTTKNGGVHTTADLMRSPRIRVSRSTTPMGLLRSMRPYLDPCGLASV